jgi:pilus assembly protein FimV
LDFEFEGSAHDRKSQRVEESKSGVEKDSFTLEKEDQGKTKERKSLDTLDELDWQLPDLEPPTATSGPSDDWMSAEEPKTQQLKGLDFEFEGSAHDRKSQRVEESKSGVEKDSFTLEKEDQGKAKERKSLDTLDELDWQLPALEPSTATPWSSRNKDLEEPETQLESLGFELEEFDKKPDLATENDEVSSTSEDYVETKLDLALAYLDMGDSVGARSLLEEVAQEGNSSQKQRAEECMAQLT